MNMTFPEECQMSRIGWSTVITEIIAPSSNGRTGVFEAPNIGSNPIRAFCVVFRFSLVGRTIDSESMKLSSNLGSGSFMLK